MNTTTPQLLAALAADPILFARAVLGVSPWSLQVAVLRAVRDHPRVAVAGAHGVGKGFTAACAALWFLFTKPRAIVLSTAPTERQVRRLLWGEIHLRHRAASIPLGGTLRPLALDLADDWYALGFTAVGPDQFQGFHARDLLVVVDEAAGIPPEIFEGVDAVLTGAGSRLLLIGNPTSRRGPFYQAFQSAAFHTFRIPATAHPNVTHDPTGTSTVISAGVSQPWIDYVKRTYGDTSAFYQARVLAQFPETEEDQLVENAWIEAAAISTAGAPGVPALGVDVARFGSDASVIAATNGGRLVRLTALRGRDLVTLAEAVVLENKRHKAAIVYIDDTGLGGGVTDQLRRRGLGVRAVVFGSRARNPERFTTIKAEMFWRLRELLRLGALGLADVASSKDGKILLEQLGLLRSEYDQAGRMIVRGSPGSLAAPSTSPDHATAVALALYGLDPRTLPDRSLAAPSAEEVAGIWFR